MDINIKNQYLYFLIQIIIKKNHLLFIYLFIYLSIYLFIYLLLIIIKK